MNTKTDVVPVISVAPISLPSPGRGSDLQLRVSAPISGNNLPLIIFSHGFGSSMNGYAPLVDFWAARGFVVIQPTFPDSRTLSADPKASHSEAVKAYLKDPRKDIIWRMRIDDVKLILDELETIEHLVPRLNGRVDHSRIAAAGHSFGAQTTAALLGARVNSPAGEPGEDMFDARIKTGILLCAAGRGGDALSEFAQKHFTYLDQNYTGMKTPTMVIAGDNDISPLTVLGPEWFTDAYELSPGANALVTLFGGEHMLGGISGYLVAETTDEDPARVAAVQELTLAYLRSQLYPGDDSWQKACADLEAAVNPPGRVDRK